MTAQHVANTLHLSTETLKKHWALFARAYWNTEDAAEITARERALAPYIALKLVAMVSKLHNGKGPVSEPFLKAISAYLR